MWKRRFLTPCSAAPAFYRDRGWVMHVPWYHSPPFPQSSNILWPADRGWVMATEMDFDSTVVPGARQLVSALVQEPVSKAIPRGSEFNNCW